MNPKRVILRKSGRHEREGKIFHSNSRRYPFQTTSATGTTSKLTSPKASALRAPVVRVRPPTIKTAGSNNNEQSRPSSRSSSLASSGTYTSIPSTTGTAPSTSTSGSATDSSTNNQKMLKIKFFGGNKDKPYNNEKRNSMHQLKPASMSKV
uniref:Uncharacterized protein n=1 Tax=Setaria digitata TaxID=48799 RepID=A0A915PUJ0_9BILA